MGLMRTYEEAQPGGDRSREFDAIAEIGGDAPHLGYPLRNIGERSFQIKLHDNDDSMGEVSQPQALRECYPGGTYYHNMQAYYIARWQTRTFQQPYIRVRKGTPGRTTRPRITTWLNSTITAHDVIDGHLRRGKHGFLAECQMMITERVEGYTDGQGEFHSYRELQQTNPNMKAKFRNFRTTGVVLSVDKEWFGKAAVRRQFSDVLREVFAHRGSLSPQDIGSTASKISVTGDGQQLGSRCVAVFDQTYGSLRFTEQLYIEFKSVLDQVMSALAVDPKAEEELLRAVEGVQEELSSFESASPFSIKTENLPGGFEQVFFPRIACMLQGERHSIGGGCHSRTGNH